MRQLFLAALLLAPSVAAAQVDAFPNFQDGTAREHLNEQHATCNVDGWWSYNPECCCTARYCAPIPGEAVKEENGGYRVVLQPGMHPLIQAPLSVWFPSGRVARSPDGRFHFCGASWTGTAPSGTARCLLVPPGGV
jgi:hypothetical protein